MANDLQITDLNFDDIKTNLKTFLSKQTEFTDYDFEGAGINVLLDLLAYNTHYNAFHANMLANEMFLDSSQLRSSVVSHAKHLGYTPRSARCSKAKVNITVNNVTTSTLTLGKGSVLTSTVDDNTYQFVVNETISITPTNGVYTFSNVDIYEGTLVTERYTVNTSDPDQRFIINNLNGDTTTLKVTVRNSSGDSTSFTYRLNTSITNISPTSRVYFLQEVEDGKFEVYFGDGILGNALDNGNIVILEYIVGNTIEANGASSFSFSGSIGGFSNIQVTTIDNASGGAVAETIKSIKFNAPKRFSAQNRAVTMGDYKAIVTDIYPNVQSIRVWGGEDNDPPIYGRVYISIKSLAGTNLTTTEKERIVSDLGQYKMASITPVVVDPETIFLTIDSDVKYDAKTTTKDANGIKTLVSNAISTFNTTNLQKFDGILRHSQLVQSVNNSDASILSNITKFKMYQQLAVNTTKSESYSVKFSNALYHPHDGHHSILSTSGFKINGDATTEYFLDDNGSGIVRLYSLSSTGVKNIKNATQGTINYTTGVVTITDLFITTLSNIDGASTTTLRVTVQPASYDVVPVRNQVLEIDLSNTNVTATADNYAETSGVGYTTTASNY